MTQTKKFSQFNGPDPIQGTDIVVGLRNGDNWQFTGVGSGGSGGVTQVITQPGHTFAKGNWLRFDEGSALYALALADTTQNAEVIGVVIESNIPVGTFTLQQAGYITSAQAVFTGLTAGVPQFLSTSSLGGMQPNDVTLDGQISRPVFLPDGADKGWVLPYRGIITDGGPNTGTSSPTPSGSDSNVITVTQNIHGFAVGDVLYVIAPVAGQATYALAQANSFATSQAVGIVIEVLNANQFMLQFAGYNLQTGGVGGITVDDMGVPLNASTVYYLSANFAGKVTSTNPTAIGTFSRPMFISERTVADGGVYSGWILPQRPLDQSPIGSQNSVVHHVVQGNAFAPGDWIYISADGTYALASANTLAQAQVAGVVLSATPTDFYVQQAGWVSGVVTALNIDGGVINSAVVYYLSTNAGKLTATVPIAPGEISKPCYVQETAGTHTGEILPQRPIVVSTPAVPGTGWTQISTQTIVNAASVSIPNMTGYYRYMIVLENIIPVNNNVPLFMRTSSNNGVSYDSGATDYTWSSYNNNVPSVYSFGDNKIQLTSNSGADIVSNIVAYGGICGTITTINPGNNLYSKQFNMQTSHRRGSEGMCIGGLTLCGARSATSVVNAVQFYFQAGNIASGTFKLYGTGV